MSRARIDQVNIVVRDAAATAEFLNGLGIPVPSTDSAWDAHHRNVPADSTFAIDLDSTAFAAHWGGLPTGYSGVVLEVRVDDRREVDQLHERALTLGARSVRAPYDAFWGSRFALVEAPGPAYVGLISVRDDAHRGPPPDPSSLGQHRDSER